MELEREENDVFQENATTVRTLRNIRNTLKTGLINKGIIQDDDKGKEVVEALLTIHGLSKKNFDFVSSMENIISGRLNDVSIDDNSNKNDKSIVGLFNEVMAPAHKAIGYDYLYRMMKKLYGKKEAKRLTGELYDFSLALSDSTKILNVYCYAFDASKIVCQGRPFGQLHSKPPKRFSSYISALDETIHQMASHLAGACLYKNQEIIYKEAGVLKTTTIKDLVDKYDLSNSFTNYQGDWEYSNLLSGLEVVEDKGRFVKINRVMRRKYNDDIYIIRTKSGKVVRVSKDHIFKVLWRGREIEVKAKDLKVFDTVFNTNFYDLPINKNSQDYKDGQFLGIIAGDGNLTEEYSIRIAINYEQTFISDWLDEYLGEHKGKLNSGHKCYTYHIYGKEFIDSIKAKFTGLRTEDKNIDISNKSLDFLVGFLDGVFTTDGSLSNKGYYLISLVNYDLIKTIQKIFEKLNINIAIKETPAHDNKQTLYSLLARGFAHRYFSLTNMKNPEVHNKKYLNENDIAYYTTNSFGKYISEDKKYDFTKIRTFTTVQARVHDPITDVITSIEKFENDDDYVYEIETESHWYSVGGLLTHNCAISTFFLDTAHMLLFKEKYSLCQIVDDIKIRKYIENCYQTFVYSVNHLSRGGVESPFTNVSIFDRVKIREFISPDNMGWYFDEAMISDEVKSEVEKFGSFNDYLVEYIVELQRIFMDYFDKGDPLKNGAPYRFPVITVNITKKKDEEGNYKILDQAFLDEMVKRDIYRYNIYTSEGTKTSMCCFDGEQKVLFRNSDGIYLEKFRDFINEYPMTKHISIFHNGFWKKFNKVSLENKARLYKITTENNKEIIITGNHICPTFNGDKPASELTKDDYLLFNTRELPCSNYLKGEQLTYEQGFLIGCILGDGSFEKRGEIITGINLSLNDGCIEEIYKKVIQALKDFDIYYTPKVKKEPNNVVSLKIHNKELAQKIISQYVPYNTAENKCFNLNLIENTIECRKGILDGWHITDGGNRWRNYSISKTLIDQMEVLCTSLGIQTNITVSDRTDEVVKIRDEEYSRNYPLYCLRTYRDCSKSKDVAYKWNNNSVYFKIKDIEFVDGSDDKVYCVEIKDDEPYFTLPNGIITHNCRLQLDTEDLKKVAGQVNSFGGSAMSMGSHRVITTNFNRVAVEATSMDDFYKRLEQKVLDTAMILKAHKELILKTEADGLQPFISNGWIAFKNLFSTFGITAVYEAGKTLKEKFLINPDHDVVKDFLVFFNQKVSEISKEVGIMANIEQIPAESMAHRLVHADQIIFGEEKIPYKLYSNQFVPLFHDATLYERMEADGKYNSLLTGGGIAHINLSERITPTQSKHVIEYAVKCGCEHFALNSIWAECEHGHVSFGKFEKCPLCGEKIVEYYTRIIGYQSPVSSWNEIRRLFDFPNRHFAGVDE